MSHELQLVGEYPPDGGSQLVVRCEGVDEDAATKAEIERLQSQNDGLRAQIGRMNNDINTLRQRLQNVRKAANGDAVEAAPYKEPM